MVKKREFVFDVLLYIREVF